MIELFKNVFWYIIEGGCERAVEKDLWRLYNVLDHFKTQEMCEKAIEKNPLCLEYVPDRSCP